MTMRKLKKLVLLIGIVLSIPLIAMQFTEEVNWQVGDFVIGGLLLLGFGVLFIYVGSALSGSKYKWAILIAIIVLLLLVWAELGVGIFGTPFAGD